MPDLWPIVVAATAYLPTEASNGRARFNAGYGSIGACPLVLTRDRLRARACPTFAAGLLKAEGRGFLENRKITQPIVLLGLELGGDFGFWGPLTAGLIARIEVPLLRERFTYYDQSGTTPALHEPKLVAISAFFTVGLRFR